MEKAAVIGRAVTPHKAPLAGDLVTTILGSDLAYVDGEILTGFAVLFSGVVFAWLLLWLAPRLLVRVFGAELRPDARRVGVHAAVMSLIATVYLSWGLFHGGAKKDLLAYEAWVVVLLVLFAALLAIAVVDLLLGWWLMKREGTAQARTMASRTFTLFIVGTAAVVLLRYFGKDVWSVITALGVGSLAIGMAAKDTLANTISGIVLLLDRPFDVGDRVRLGVKEAAHTGDVLEIGLRSTRIRLLDNTLLVIPNSELCNSQLVNVSSSEQVVGRVELKLEWSPANVPVVSGLASEIARLLSVPGEAVSAQFVSLGDGSVTVAVTYPVAAGSVCASYHLVAQYLQVWLPGSGATLFDARRRCLSCAGCALGGCSARS